VISPQFHILALTPHGTSDPAIAIAASRAGELGVLDLQRRLVRPHPDNAQRRDDARAALAVLAARAGAPFGIKLDTRDAGLLDDLMAAAPDGLTLVILDHEATDALPRAISSLRAKGLSVLVEVTDLPQALSAVGAGATGVIAKGHEAGGRVGEESTFVLLQHLLGALDAPVYAHGGIGLHGAAACYAAGAAGVVLDSQLFLTRESTLSDAVKEKIAAMDGSETAVLGTRLGAPYRLYARPGLAALEELRALESRYETMEATSADLVKDWRDAVESRIGWGSPAGSVYALGQDAAFAASLADRFVSVSGVLSAIRTAIAGHCSTAGELRPLEENAPLARAHATRYPIVQGPMTRVSDTAAFAGAVADGGGLPFLALALLRGEEVRALLEQTRELLGARPWGVGILGFVSQELREEQIAVIREVRPPWALIAGGRPAQAYSLEQQGIPTYLHVPSPGLLRMFLQDGAHRFVFEGRECGGHVGPRTSFVLWETMIDVLLEARRTPQDPPIDVLFAGGIHDARSAAMVAAMAAPLAERGMRIGVLMGTAYLFTEEAVSSGTIMPAFQQEAISCTQTVLLESGPGHATRCVATPFAGVFEAERRRLLAEGAGAEEMRSALEDLNLGRLRIASKGITRNPRYGKDPDAARFVSLSEEEQRADGMYMIGQVAGLRDSVTTIANLHDEVSAGSTALLERLATAGDEIGEADAATPPPCDVAIVGISAVMPKARDARTYWENILNKVNAIGEVPLDRFDWRRYYDEDKTARDRIYSHWGGFLDDVPFDPLSYGMPPNSLRSVEPLQLLTLEAVRAALDDAGYLRRPVSHERTAVILGASGVSDLGLLYGVRTTLPMYVDGKGDTLTEKLAEVLPEWTEDSFPGVLMNVTSGRVTNRFDFGGTNFTVDAACASSLAAISAGVNELQLGKADLVVAGGGDTAQNAHAFMAFSKTQALSPRGRCRPFDATADGIAISEGVAIVILKRLADAERDGDRIYAVIKGVGSSSDGRDKSLTAPRPEGQMRALRRAYRQAGFSPATVGLIEAHGTGTVVGDKAEVASLSTLFEEYGAQPGSCAIGSVKSMIGHTKATAGVAGLIKVALALYHRTLPPTLVETPNPSAGFGENAFYVNSEARPWLAPIDGTPRRAGVSAFGFGGTNFHVALEEYTGAYLPPEPLARTWPCELFVFRGPTREAILGSVQAVIGGLERGAQPALLDLAASLARGAEAAGPEALSLAIVASTLDDLRAKLQTAAEALGAAAGSIDDPRGIYFSAQPLARDGKVALLFPGQGSQYVNMLRDLALQFTEVRAVLEQADSALRERFPRGLSAYVFPPPTFGKEDDERDQARLTATQVAQPALGAADAAMLALLRSFGLEADLMAGHSYGEFAALYAADVFDADTFFMLSEARGRFMAEAAGADDPGTMAAALSDAASVAAAIEGIEGVVLANLNAPNQTVISGTSAGVAEAIARLEERKIRVRPLPVSCAFHSPLVAGARDKLARVINKARFHVPTRPVYANSTGEVYPGKVRAMATLLADQLASPVRFVDEIEAMYADGARVFIEAGPRNVLTGLADAILKGRPHQCIATDQAKRPGLVQLQHALAQMLAQGVSLSLERLYQGRQPRRLDIRLMNEHTGRTDLPPTTWLVNGGYVRPIGQDRRTMAPVALAVDYEALERGELPGPLAPLKGNNLQLDAAPQTMTTTREVEMTDHQREGRGSPGWLQQSSHGVNPAPNGHAHNGLSAPVSSAEGLANGSLHAPVSAAEQHAPDGGLSAPVPAGHPAHGDSDQPWAPYPVAAAPVYIDEMSATVMQFQQVMAQFLETQRAVMGAYFGQAPAAEMLPSAPALPAYTPPAYVAQPAINVAPPPYAPPSAPLPVYQPPAASPATAPQTERPGTAAVVAPVPELPVQQAAPAPVVAPAPAAAPAVEAPPLDEAELTRRLLAIVAERTGYPTEMLDLDLDLEADLGIDSIKRVEIVGSLRRAVGTTGIADGAMEKLSSVKSLRAIVSGMMEILAPLTQAHPPPAISHSATVSAPDASHASVAAVPRFTLRATTAPSTDSRHFAVSLEGTVVVTDDGRGIAQALAAELRRRGHQVAILRAASHSEEIGQDTFAADMADPSSVAGALQMIRQRHGALGGIVHLLPLRGETPRRESMDLMGWKQRIAEDVKGLFYLAHAAGPELVAASAGADKKGALIAVTGMGGAFGYAVEGHTPDFFAGHGGIPGFLKTLGLEWPGVQVKAVDVDPTAAAADLAQQILDELTLGDNELEIGRRCSARLILEPVLAPLDLDATPRIALDASSVVLVTGGARGITAAVAAELARRCPLTLILAGRSALPAAREDAETAGLTAAREIKAALIARLRASGQQPTPALVEAAYGRLLQDREMREALARLRETGARVSYVPVDVREEAALSAMIAEIYTTHGRLDGVIHGAGVIEDKLVLDKTPRSFERVFDTKADSAFVLARALQPESLTFLAFFSSVTARFGNRGQADYGATNDVVNKLALELDRLWPARVVSFNWGPWGAVSESGRGMVGAEIEAQFARRGVELIDPQIGCRRAVEELLFGRKGDVEVVYGSGPWSHGQRRMVVT